MRNERSGYRAEIDGLRAVAILAVLFFHFDLGVPGGYVGVDVFFVISGYLITRLITHDQADGRFSLAQFWLRRLRRLFPSLALVLAATAVAGYWLFLPGDFKQFGQSLVAQTALSSNVFF